MHPFVLRGLQGLFAVTVATLVCSGCSSAEPAAPQEGPAATQAARGEELVGVWRFVYDDARRRDHEAKLAAEIGDPAALAKAKREAEEEAAVSELEFTAEGWFLSRIGDKEIARAPYNTERVAEETVRLTLMKEGQTKSTEVELVRAGDKRRIILFDPRKGPLTFEQK